MAKGRGPTNNVRAGAFVLLAIFAAFVIVVLLSGAMDRMWPKRSYVVRFSLAEGATGLDKGSVVKVAGRPVGYVGEIELRTEPRDAQPAAVDCAVKIRREVRLYPGVVAYLDRPLLGSGAEINFPGVGDVGGAALEAGSVIRGTLAPPSFLAAAGYGEEQKSQVQTILKRGEEIAEDIKGITGDVKVVAADVKDRWPAWGERVDSITANVDDASKSLKPGIEEVREVVARARAWFDENRDKLTRIVDNVEAGTGDAREALARLNAETVDKLHAMLDEGRATASSAREAIERIDGFVREQAPGLRRSLANARLASDQLKMTLAEVRRAPWRLLFRPDTRELEFELLYDSARAYAESAGDLRAAGEALAAVRAEDGADQSRLAEMTEELSAALERYKRAEDAFLRLVVEGEKK